MLWLIALGLLIGLIGTMVGAGGGFLLMPVLLFLYPAETPEVLTGISMAVVCLNALSGTLAYVLMRRVDFRAGLIFSLAAFPGAFLGAYATRFLARDQFEGFLGLALILFGTLLFWKAFKLPPPLDDAHRTTGAKKVLASGALISAGVGFISSILGIGGGIIHVPALVYMLKFPVHIATATSHFVLAGTSSVAVFQHLWSGNYDHTWKLVAYLGVGVVIGAQFGARLSKRIHSKMIIVVLAIAIMFVGARLIWGALG